MTAYPFTKVGVFCLHRKAVAIPVGEQPNLLQYVSCHRIRPLYGVSPYDLSTFAGVTAVLTAVAIATSYVPALRAMRLDPITTLHSE